MTTNQKIDGVPRELALRLLLANGSELAKSRKELRALLDAPAENVIDVSVVSWNAIQQAASESTWMPSEYMRNDWVDDVCRFLREGPAAQPQGVPVHMVRSHGSCCWEEMRGESLEMCKAQSDEYEVRKLYAEQPAPVDQGGWEKLARLAAYYLSPAIVSHQWNMTDETRKEALGVCHAINNGKPAPVAVVPEDYCMMPRQLTAENGAKALLLGEFELLVTKECPECCELEEPTEGCSICDGEGEYGQKHTIPWHQIKFIYSKAVSGLALKAESPKSR